MAMPVRRKEALEPIGTGYKTQLDLISGNLPGSWVAVFSE